MSVWRSDIELGLSPADLHDYATGVLGAFGAVLALHHRGRTQKGQLVETSLLRATALEQIPWIVGEPDGAIARTSGRAATGWSALQRIYQTSDGWLFLGVAVDQTHLVLTVVGEDAQVSNLEATLEATLEMAFARATTNVVCDALLAVEVGALPIMSLPELMVPGGIADQRGIRVSDTSSRHGMVVMPGPVVRFSETPMRPGALPKVFGDDRDEVLSRH